MSRRKRKKYIFCKHLEVYRCEFSIGNDLNSIPLSRRSAQSAVSQTRGGGSEPKMLPCGYFRSIKLRSLIELCCEMHKSCPGKLKLLDKHSRANSTSMSSCLWSFISPDTATLHHVAILLSTENPLVH